MRRNGRDTRTDGRRAASAVNPLGRLRDSQRATTLVLVALGAAVLLGASALAVDLGMLITARVQSQRAADSGALAGAMELASMGGTEADARAEARRFANSHRVVTSPVAVEDGDVEIVGDTVRVRVRHSIGTLFARILGVEAVDVSTVAAAEAVSAGSAHCPIPVMGVDNWVDAEPQDGLYNPDDGDVYTSCANGEPCTGFSRDDAGMVLEIKSQNTSSGESATQTCGAENPEWYCWVDNQVGKGDVDTDELEDIFFNGCANTEFDVSIDSDLESSPGNKMSVVQSVKQFIDDNGGADLSWNGECVWNSATASCAPSSHPLIRSMPMTDPSTISGSGEGARATVTNFVPIWIEKVGESYEPSDVNGNGPGGQWNIYVRIIDGVVDGVGGGGQPDALLKAIVLVE